MKKEACAKPRGHILCKRLWPVTEPPVATAGTSLLRRALQHLRHLDLDAAIGDLVAVVLEVDLAPLQSAELFPGVELAFGNALLPVVAAQVVGDNLLAVEPVLDVS